MSLSKNIHELVTFLGPKKTQIMEKEGKGAIEINRPFGTV